MDGSTPSLIFRRAAPLSRRQDVCLAANRTDTDLDATLEALAAQGLLPPDIARRVRQLGDENRAHRQMIETLRKTEMALSATQRLSKTGRWRWEPDTDLLEWSDETYALFDCDKGSVTPSYALFLDRIHPEDREAIARKTGAAAAERREFYQDYRIVARDGTIRHLQAVGIPHADDPAAGGAGRFEYIGIVIDVTGRQQADDALRTAQAEAARVSHLTTMGQLTASIAHELNQPLAAITTNAEASLRWLDRAQPDLAEARGAVTRVLRDVTRAADVIRSIRALVRNAGADVAEIDIGGLIADSHRLIMPDLRRGGTAFDLCLPEQPLRVRGDRVQLQQVLFNLIRNAIEAMAATEPHRRMLVVSVHDDDPAAVDIRVSDTGSGIDPTVIGRLFEPMVTTKPDGMGMGLSICRSIIEAHGGRLWAEARVPQGSVFGFTLRRAAPV